jgi:hypothetical protein
MISFHLLRCGRAVALSLSLSLFSVARHSRFSLDARRSTLARLSSCLLLCVLVGCLDRTISISSRIALTFVDPYDISLLNQSLSFLFLIFLQSEPRVSSLVSSFLPFFPLSRLLFRSSLFVSLSLASSLLVCCRFPSLRFSSSRSRVPSLSFLFGPALPLPAPHWITQRDLAARRSIAE